MQLYSFMSHPQLPMFPKRSLDKAYCFQREHIEEAYYWMTSRQSQGFVFQLKTLGKCTFYDKLLYFTSPLTLNM